MCVYWRIPKEDLDFVDRESWRIPSMFRTTETNSAPAIQGSFSDSIRPTLGGAADIWWGASFETFR